MPAILRNLLFFPTLVLSLNTLLLCCFSLEDQGHALLEWKKSLNISGDALKSWSSSDQSPCNWIGIRCNSNGDVVELSLKSMDLQGPLPSNLQALKSLSTLVLSSTNLTGAIPKQIGDYHALTVFDLSDNSLTGEIPVEICKLSKLETLALNTNFLEGGIPSEIGNLTNLVYLTLYDNQLSGTIPNSIGRLARLETFRAGGNQNLKGELPWEIGNCSNLVKLGLAETSISGSLPSSIRMLKRIQTIALYTTLLSGPIPEEIGECSELQNLYLYQNSISGQIPKQMGQLKKLQSVLLWQNNLVGTIPEELGSCTELTVTDFSENQLTGSIPRSFGMLQKLQELQLSINQLSGLCDRTSLSVRSQELKLEGLGKWMDLLCARTFAFVRSHKCWPKYRFVVRSHKSSWRSHGLKFCSVVRSHKLCRALAQGVDLAWTEGLLGVRSHKLSCAIAGSRGFWPLDLKRGLHDVVCCLFKAKLSRFATTHQTQISRPASSATRFLGFFTQIWEFLIRASFRCIPSPRIIFGPPQTRSNHRSSSPWDFPRYSGEFCSGKV